MPTPDTPTIPTIPTIPTYDVVLQVEVLQRGGASQGLGGHSLQSVAVQPELLEENI